MKVLVDPGHGGQDPGACSDGLCEADINLTVATLLISELRARGFEAYLTRDHDASMSLEERCGMERKFKPDLFVSIHCNAAYNREANGFEIWTSPGQTKSDQYADSILAAFSLSFPGRRIRRDLSDGDGDKEAKFRVLTGTNGPGVLIELGFITNAEDAKFIKSSRQAIVKAIVAGIEVGHEELDR